MRCDGPYSRKPLRQRERASVGYAFASAYALLRSAKLHKQMRPATALSRRPRDESW